VTFPINSLIGLAKNKSLSVLLCAVTAVILTAPAYASDAVWSLDSGESAARLYLGSMTNPDSVNVGVARVAGTVSLDTNDLNSSVVDLSVYPADEDWGPSLSPEGKPPFGYVPDSTDHTLLMFKSKRILRAVDGQLRVIGDLTLTRVKRSVTAEPNEAYAGPIYGDYVIHTVTQEITFVFPNPNDVVSASQPSTTANKQRLVDVSASARIRHEDFTELSDAIAETNWPSVVANKHCDGPSTVGEDYNGAKCKGATIAAAAPANCHLTATVGEDYSGAVCDPPAGDQTTIVLQLKLINLNV
jgi:hypothetical protein